MRNCKLREGTTSEYKGVSWKKKNQIWEVRIRDGNGGNKYLGCFTNEIAAANCYNYHALRDFGEFAYLNIVEYMSKEDWEKHSSASKKTSRYRGVCYVNSTGKYLAQIWDTRQRLRIGEFDTEEEAAIAYDEKAIELKGIKAKLNFG